MNKTKTKKFSPSQNVYNLPPTVFTFAQYNMFAMKERRNLHSGKREYEQTMNKTKTKKFSPSQKVYNLPPTVFTFAQYNMLASEGENTPQRKERW